MGMSKLSEITFICEECNSINYLHQVKLKKHNIFECQHCDAESYFTKGTENVYALDSEYSNLVKVGFTSRDPINRLNEINLATGAIPWDVALYYKTLSGQKLEQKIYSTFDQYRVQKKEQLDLNLEELAFGIKDKFEIIPNYVRQDYEQLKSSLRNSHTGTKHWEGSCMYCNEEFTVTLYHDTGVCCPNCSKFNRFSDFQEN